MAALDVDWRIQRAARGMNAVVIKKLGDCGDNGTSAGCLSATMMEMRVKRRL